MALSEQQLAVRATGLGGTDILAICGENDYRSAIDVYLEKRHGLGLPIPTAPPEPFEGNERTEFGHILEPVLANRYASDTGMHLVEPKDEAGENITFRHPDRPWHMGTPDRLCYDGDIEFKPLHVLNAITGDAVGHFIKTPSLIWEAKTHGMMAAKAYDLENMTVPDDKKIQVAWYRALTGVKEADLSVLIDTHFYRVFHIPHDQEVEDYLLEEGELFWKRIQDGVEPEPDGTKGFSRYLAQRFKLHTADMIEMPVECAKQIATYKAARADRKAADGVMKLAQQEIQLAIGGHQGLLLGRKPVVTWKRRQKGTVSHGKLSIHLRDLAGMTDLEFECEKDKFTGEPPRDFKVK